ncbi:MAG: tyrosine-type recombinase/integrase [Actinomycetota bacterium]
MAHIEKRGEGRYRVRYRDPDGRERSKTFALRRDARRFQSVVEEEIARGIWVDPRAGRRKFGAFAPAVVEPRSSVRPATSARIASYLRVQIMPAFGESPVGKITRVSVQAWVDAMAQTLGPRTVRDSYRVFAGFMREAERQGLIRQSPCYSIVLPRMARPEPRFLGPDQVERLAAAIDARYEPLIYTGAYLGPRWSELAGLKRTNLDLDGRRLRIVGALERVGSGWRYSEQLKTPRSRRTLSIPKFVADLLAEQLMMAPESEFVFSSPCGDILNYRNFRRRFWDPAVARADLVGVTPHALRHTCVALMIAEGANPLMVQRQLGHADLRMTLGTYGHLFPNWDGDVADRMQELWWRTKAA